jgi:hypothetical protein
MRQVGYLSELYRDLRSIKHRILKHNILQPVLSETYLPLSCMIFSPSSLKYVEYPTNYNTQNCEHLHFLHFIKLDLSA